MPKNSRAGRDERIKSELFPEDAENVFDTSTKGFVPLPIEYRELLRYLTAAQARVLIYLVLRASKSGICFPTVEEIAHGIGVSAVKHVRPILRGLEQKGFIRTGAKAGRAYYLILDPKAPIGALRSLQLMSDEALRDINSLREDLGHEPVEIE